MGLEYLQSNLTGGELAPTLHARTDIDKYNTALAEAENVVIVPQGGLRRRPGLAKHITIGEDARLEPFIFNKSQQYLLVFKAGFIDIVRDGVVVKADLVSPYTTMDIVDGIDIIQSADTVIMTYEDIAPQRLVRGATDVDWTIDAIPLTIPNNDFGSGNEPVWSATRGYPISCCFHMGRLWFGGSTSKPTSVWGSRVNGFFDFTWVETSGVVPDDHAIFDTIESGQYNKITNIFSARGLQVFTTGSEFFNTVDIITPANSAWEAQTGYGSKGLRPIFIDGATLFVDSSSRNIREFVYSFDEDSYVSNSITLLASHLLTDIKAIAAIKGTTLDISDFVYVVNSDGSLAVMNTLRNESILGWTHWTTQGEFLDVCVVDKEVFFLVKRMGEYFIETVDENSYTDHSVVISGTEPITDNVTHLSDNVVFDLTQNVIYTDTSTGTPVDTITTDYDPVFNDTEFKVIADYSMQDDTVPTVTAPGENTFTITREAYRLEVGLDYNTKIVTLPIGGSLKSGSTLHRRKRVVKVEMNIYESLGVYARNIYAADRQFTVALDEAPEPFTGFKELYLLGYTRLTQIEITQINPLPMLIRGIGYEIEY